MMKDLIRQAVPAQNTTIGTARALFYNCKQQADNALWYTSKFNFFVIDGRYFSRLMQVNSTSMRLTFTWLPFQMEELGPNFAQSTLSS